MRFVVATLLLFVAALCAPLALLSRAAAGYRPLVGAWQSIGVDQLRPGARVVASGRGAPAATGERLRGRGWRIIAGAAMAALLGAALALLGRARRAAAAAAWCAVIGLIVVVSRGAAEALTVLATSAALLGAVGQSWSAWRVQRCGRATRQAGR